jgi:hypothetical protein
MRAQNRHDTLKWKKKSHLAAKCRKAKCGICHPNKAIGGNNKTAIKPKYYLKYKSLVEI